MEHTFALLLFCGVWLISTTNTQSTAQRFQAEKFLDMLGKSYDSKLAYVDLLSALNKRLNLDTAVQSNGSASISDGGSANINAMAETVANCQEAPPRQGASITYTSQNRVMGSRALYQCDPGYDGQSKFIQCGNGGQWTSLGTWAGCIPVDCGATPPSVQNADSSFTTTKFQSTVLFTCQAGYKMNVSNANITCLDTGLWESPNFVCEKDNSPSNPMMAALMQSMPGFASMPNTGLAGSPSMLPSSMNSNNPMAAMIAHMFQKSAQTPPPTPTTTTTITPTVKMRPGGFQLPSHLQNLLPNGISSTSGMRPQDLMALASMGLGSNNPAAAPRDLNQLLGTMNPMSLFGGAMGLNMGGAGVAGMGAGTGPGGVPPDPERMAEQREEMMMRAMMASAMKSMMGPGSQGNTSSNHNPAADMMTLMALQNGLSGGGGGGVAAGGAAGGFDPLAMMLGGMSGGAPSGGLFGSLFA